VQDSCLNKLKYFKIKKQKMIRHRNLWVMLSVDAAIVVFAYYLSYLLRFDGAIPHTYMSSFNRTVVWILPLKLLFFYVFGLYKGMWRYTSIGDLQSLAASSLAGTGTIMLILLISVRFAGFARSVFIIDFFLTFIFIGGFRIAIRLFYHKQNKGLFFSSFNSQKAGSKHVLIVGAGDAGEKVLRGLFDEPQLQLKPIGFVDDDPGKIGREIHHVPVRGSMNRIPALVEEFDVDEIFITIPSASGDQMRNIVKLCKDCGVQYKTLPGLADLINGQVTISDLREVRFEDLLGRPAVDLDATNIKDYITGRRILITGAGGSIGSELCRQIVNYHPESIVLFDASESNLYAIQMELETRIGYKNYIPVLGGIQNETLAEKVFSAYRPQVVFHAAAYKHVPMMELNPWQAVQNNIRGTECLLECSIHWKVQNFVLVSTDKSVKPTNVMGASKRVCELLLQSLMGNGTALMAVRFGNVVGSSGSVLPLFREQIERGGPVTVTHPDVTRFFMTIPEACQLIIQAGGLGQGGEIFVLEMGTPVRIADMARDLIRLSGKEPDKDIEIKYTGLRPGEKLYEELITYGEGVVPTGHDKIMVLKTDGNWNGNGNQKAFRSWLTAHLDELYHLADLHRAEDIRKKLKCIVPEYKVQAGSCVLDVPCSESLNPKTTGSDENNQKVEYQRNPKKAALSTT
jgi:FlaA1/EpsC-like NDP-sugar epimerase